MGPGCGGDKWLGKGTLGSGKRLPGIPQSNENNHTESCWRASLTQTVPHFPGDYRLCQASDWKLAIMESVRQHRAQVFVKGTWGRVSEDTAYVHRSPCRAREQGGNGPELLLADALGVRLQPRGIGKWRPDHFRVIGHMGRLRLTMCCGTGTATSNDNKRIKHWLLSFDTADLARCVLLTKVSNNSCGSTHQKSQGSGPAPKQMCAYIAMLRYCFSSAAETSGSRRVQHIHP